MSASNSRKRAAPGTSPAMPMQQRMQQPYAGDNVVNDMSRWNGVGDAAGFMDNTGYGNYGFGQMAAPQQYQQAVPGPSNTVARRTMNQALVPTNQRGVYDASTDPWATFGDDGALLQQGTGEEAPEEDNIEKLEEMAQKAKREAQAKRKQIPPFVQKLSSFLEEGKNEELIHWSEKGDSFIVLDEDEFAKRLIPELFKHNNYASFVRQLNMYGFHKCVGLSDNSMRASERKNKSPSEYANPYFRRGHPNLLWLINKPKSGGKGKKANSKNAEGEGESDDDVLNDDAAGHQGGGLSNAAPKALPSTETPPPPKKEMGVIREELQKVREQQKLILGAINRLQRNNNDLYNQALMFQNQHDRHQNSINAILNFLANVFRKTLEDQNSTQNVSDIISSMLTSQGGQGHGNVVDLGDFIQSQMDASNSLGGGPPKRTRGLLPPIPGQQADTSSGQGYRSPSVSNPYQQPQQQQGNSHNPEMGHVTELLDSETPPTLRQELEANPQERMMKIINDHNATNNTGFDLPEAAEIVANAPNTLNNDQRSQLVNFMAGQASPSGSTPGTGAAPSRSPTAPPKQPSSSPPAPAAAPAAPEKSAAAPSLSPIMRSPVMPAPSLSNIGANKEELDQLQRLQSEQDAKISELGSMLGPLSPSGRIPGLDGQDGFFDAPNVDLDQYFNSDAFLNDANFGDGTDFNFNIDSDAQHNGGKRNDTPSPTGTEEIQREDFNSEGEGSNKRQRTT